MSKKIFIAVPCYEGISARTTACVLSILTAAGYPGVLSLYPGCAVIALARSELLGRFLHSDCSHMLFLDSDIGFEGSLVKRMVETELDVVIGSYVGRLEPHNPVINVYDPPQYLTAPNGEKLVQVHSAGLGCTLLSRKAIEDTCKYFPDLEYMSLDTKKPSYCLFLEALGKGPGEDMVRFWGEDVMFFSRLQEAGFPIYAMMDAKINHAGYDFCLGDRMVEMESSEIK